MPGFAAPISGHRLRWLAAGLGIVVVFVLANRAIVLGRAVPLWDANKQFAPWQMLIGDYARAGRVMLWNPWTDGGAPDFAEPQAGALSPVAVAVGALAGGSFVAFRIYWLSIWLLGGIGVLILARHLRAPPWGAVIVGLGFLFSGFYTGHAEHISRLVSISWLPFVVWRLDVALVRRRWWPAVEAGAIWGLSALGGYPSLVMITAGYAALWIVGRVLFGMEPARPVPTLPDAGGVSPLRRTGAPLALAAVVLFVGVGLIVMSPTYLGFLAEGPGYSDRAGPLPRERAVNENALHPGALTTYSSPYLSSLQLTRPRFWPYTDASSVSVYVGPLVAWLGLFALTARPSSRWRWWLAGLGALCLAVAVARVLPLRGWLYDLFPPTRYFRHAAEFRDYAIFSVVVLAILGTRDLAGVFGDRVTRFRKRLLVPALVLGVSAVACFVTVMLLAEDRGRDPWHAALHVGTAWSAVGFFAWVAAFIRRPQHRHLFVAALLAFAAFDAVCTVHLAKTTIYTTDPWAIQEWRWIDSHRSASLDLTTNGRDRVANSAFDRIPVNNKNLPMKVPVLHGYSAHNSRLHLSWVANGVLVNAAVGRQRIWFASQTARIPPSDEAFGAFRFRVLLERTIPLLLHDRDAMRRLARRDTLVAPASERMAEIAALPAAVRVPVEVLEYTPDVLEFRVECPSTGWLWVTDRWSAGWRATVNGQDVEVWGGNFIFRAVQVAAGRNHVRFEYHPFGFPVLFMLSWATLMMVGGVALVRAVGSTGGSRPRV